MVFQISILKSKFVHFFLPQFVCSFFRGWDSRGSLGLVIECTKSNLGLFFIGFFDVWIEMRLFEGCLEVRLFENLFSFKLSDSFIELFDELLCQWAPFHKIIFNAFMEFKFSSKVFNFYLKLLVFLQEILYFFSLKLDFVCILLILNHYASLLFLVGETSEVSIGILDEFYFVWIYLWGNVVMWWDCGKILFQFIYF